MMEDGRGEDYLAQGRRACGGFGEIRVPVGKRGFITTEYTEYTEWEWDMA